MSMFTPPSWEADWRPHSLINKSYGDGRCPICGRFHNEDNWLFESGGSRAYVETMIAKLTPIVQSLSRRQMFKNSCMMGALIAKGPYKVLIAVSGIASKGAFDQMAVSMRNVHVCGDVPRPVTTRGGRVIGDAELAAMRVDAQPLTCAAPKLIHAARARGYPLPYDMTEVWFDLASHEKHKFRKVGYTKHAWAIDSCRTCKNVIPALMCDAR